MAVSISGIQDINTRLDPVRKLLADIDEAVKYATSVQNGLAEKEARLKNLQKDAQKLEAHKVGLENEIKTLNADFNRQQQELSVKLSAASREFQEKTSGYQTQTQALEKSYREKAALLEKTYAEREAELKAETAKSEQRLQALNAEIERARKRMAQVLAA